MFEIDKIQKSCHKTQTASTIIDITALIGKCKLIVRNALHLVEFSDIYNISKICFPFCKQKFIVEPYW